MSDAKISSRHFAKIFQACIFSCFFVNIKVSTPRQNPADTRNNKFRGNFLILCKIKF